MTQEEHNHMVEQFMDRINQMVRLIITRSWVNSNDADEREIENLKSEAAQILLRLTAPF